MPGPRGPGPLVIAPAEGHWDRPEQLLAGLVVHGPVVP